MTTVKSHKLSECVASVASEGLFRLRESCIQSHQLDSEEQRKTQLLRCVELIRHQLLRLMVLVRWAGQSDDVVSSGQRLLSLLEQHNSNITAVADQAFDVHFAFTQDIHRLPSLPVHLAADVLCGQNSQMPKAITAIGLEVSPPSTEEVSGTLQRLNHLIRGRILTSTGIELFSKSKIDQGQLHCGVDDEFEMWLTLEGDADVHWRILDLKILVESAEGRRVSREQTLELHQMMKLQLESKDDCREDLKLLHQIAHEFCMQLQLDILGLQAEEMARNQWARVILGVSTPERAGDLQLYYWRNVDNQRASGSRANTATCQLRIFVNLANDLQVSSEPKLDTEDEAFERELCSNGKLNLHNLFHWMIRKQMETRLEMLHRYLLNSQLPCMQNDGIYVEKSDDGIVGDVLVLRLSEFLEIQVCIDLRSGKFVVRSSDVSELALKDLEMELNGAGSDGSGSGGGGGGGDAKKFFLRLCRQALAAEMRAAASLLGLSSLPSLPFMPNSDTASVNKQSHTVYVRFPESNIMFLVVTFTKELLPEFQLLCATADTGDQIFLSAAQMHAASGSTCLKRKINLEDAARSKRQKLDTTTHKTNENDQIRNTFADLILATVEINKPAAQMMCLVHMLNEAGVAYKDVASGGGGGGGTEQSLAVTISCEPLEVSLARVKPRPHGGFAVELPVRRDILTIGEDPEQEHTGNGGVIKYDRGHLLLAYDASGTWQKFLSDLDAVTIIAQMAKEVRLLCDTPGAKFRLQTQKFTRLVVVHEIPEKPQQLQFSWNHSSCSVDFHRMSSAHLIDKHLVCLFSLHRRATPVLTALAKIWVPLKIIEDLAVEKHGQIVVIPRGHQDLRLVFVRSNYSVDIVFHTDNEVAFRTALRNGEPSSNSSRGLALIPRFAAFVEQVLLPSLPNAESNRRDGGRRSEVVIPHQYLGDCLNKLHAYASSIFLLLIGNLYVKDDERKNKPQNASKVERIFNKDNMTMTIKNEAIAVEISLPTFIQLQLKATDNGDGANGAMVMKPEWKESLERFVATRVAVEPYNIECTATLMALLVLPYRALRLFAKLINAEMRAENAKFQLHLDNTVKHEAERQTVKFPVLVHDAEMRDPVQLMLLYGGGVTGVPPQIQVVPDEPAASSNAVLELIGQLSLVITADGF